MKSALFAVAVGLSIPLSPAFADPTKVIAGGEVFTTNVTGDVTLEGNWIIEGTLQKTGAGKLTFPVENVRFVNGGRLDVLSGEVVAAKTTGVAAEFPKPTAILNKAGFWVDANKNVILDGDNVTKWIDCRDDATSDTRQYIYGQSMTNLAIDVSKPDVPPSWPTLGTDGDKPYVFFGKFGSGQWMAWQTPADKEAWLRCYNSFIVYNPLDSHGHFFGSNNNQETSEIDHKMYFAVSGNGLVSDHLFSEARSATPEIYAPIRSGRVFVNGVQTQPDEWIKKNALQLIEVEASGWKAPCAENFFNFRSYQQKAGSFSNGNRLGGSRLHEVLVFTNLLTQAERLQVGAYLTRKWVTSALGCPDEINVADGARVVLPGEYLASSRLRLDGELLTTGSAADLTRLCGVFSQPTGLLALTDGVTVTNKVLMAVKTESGKTYAVTDGGALTASVGEAGKVGKTGGGALALSALPDGVSLAVTGGRAVVRPPQPKALPTTGGNVVKDGGFEIPAFANNMNITAGTQFGAWTSEAVEPNSVRVYKNGAWMSNVDLVAPIKEGQLVLVLKNKGGVRQEIDVPAAGRYQLSMLLGCRTDSTSYAAALAISIDGVTIAGQPTRYEGPDRKLWVPYRTVTPYLTAGKHVLRFTLGYKEDRAAAIDDVRLVWQDDVHTADIPNANFEAVDWKSEKCPTWDVLWQTAWPGTNILGWTIGGADNRVFLARHATEYEGTGGDAKSLWSPSGRYNALLISGGEMSTSFKVRETGVYRFSARMARHGESGGELADVANMPIKVSVNGDVEEIEVSAFTWNLKRLSGAKTYALTAGDTVELKLSLDTPSCAQGTKYLYRIALDDLLFESEKNGNLLQNPSFSEGSDGAFLTNHWEAAIAGTRSMTYGSNDNFGLKLIDGACFRVHGTGSVRQTVTLPSAGLYRLAFWARTRCYQGHVEFGPNDMEVTVRFGSGETTVIGRVEPSRTDLDFQLFEYYFRAEEEDVGECTVGVQGLEPTEDKSSFVDAFSLVRVADQPEGWKPFAETTEVTVAEGAKLDLNYEGELPISRFHYGRRSISRTIDALTHPETVGGLGGLYVEPRGAILLIR